MNNPDIRVIIPAYNEENAVGLVIDEIPKRLVSEVIVVDNDSSDNTAEAAKKRGATVILQSKKGYGNACLKGMEYIKNSSTQPDIVVFLDGDHSDYPEKMVELIQPIIGNKAEMVIGSRALGQKQRGSMTFPQIFGNWLSTKLLKLIYGVKYTDLGPFRAIKYSSLLLLHMKDRTFGWTVEMQLKIAKLSLRFVEIPVDYRVRVGKSKVSGTIKGALMAGYKILYTIFKYR
ncbi:MAG: glycosyltransferase family 2 protein [Cytophagales bacterium]|nr:glycosyltransferase family 2 protein [Cytophagales bacterium]